MTISELRRGETHMKKDIERIELQIDSFEMGMKKLRYDASAIEKGFNLKIGNRLNSQQRDREKKKVTGKLSSYEDRIVAAKIIKDGYKKMLLAIQKDLAVETRKKAPRGLAKKTKNEN